MAKQAKDSKSTRLKELEDVFERRTRRFSPFEVLGLKSTGDLERETDFQQSPAFHSVIDEKTGENYNPPMEGSDPPTSGMGRPSPGAGRPTKVVEVGKYTSTSKNPPMEGSDPPTSGSSRPTPGSSSIPPNLQSDPYAQPLIITPTHSAFEVNTPKRSPEISLPQTLSTVADYVAATHTAAQIGPKARKVLAYLNSIRSLEYEVYTVPVGYGQISSHVGVDSDYLRRKALPKLAMLGFIAIARKNLEGTVYHLLRDREYINTVTGESLPMTAPISTAIIAVAESSLDPFSSPDWPDWIDKEQWGWLSSESIRRLVQKSGSEAQAREKLDIIAYNETHGAPHQRVRNRRSVLAHYLSSTQAEIWPNDDGFETLAIKQARLEREQAQNEKALAEEVLRAKREAQKARFSASLSDSQLQWIKQEAKRTVEMRPEAKLLTSRFPLYKAEESRLLEEWMERVGYGETIPSIQSEHT